MIEMEIGIGFTDRALAVHPKLQQEQRFRHAAPVGSPSPIQIQIGDMLKMQGVAAGQMLVIGRQWTLMADEMRLFLLLDLPTQPEAGP